MGVHLHLEDAVAAIHFEKIGELLTVILEAGTAYETGSLSAHAFALRKPPIRTGGLHKSLFSGLLLTHRR
jgi:hypothetical protein